MGDERPKIALESHYFDQLYLYAFASQGEVYQHIRTQAIKDERQRSDAILAAWRGVRPRVTHVLQNEAGLPDTITVQAIAPEYAAQIQKIEQDPLFQKTFVGATFGVIEVDKVVAAQRTVNLAYVEKISSRLPNAPSMADLIEFCISPNREMDPIQHLEVTQNVHAFSSPNSDVRFLGSFIKDLEPSDLQYAEGGGLPAAAILVFVGYGSPQIHVYRVGNRVVLGNGFHRVYALRQRGITEIPVVIRNVQNPSLEFPQAIGGIPRDYLLSTPRPTLIKDFLEPDFTVQLRVQERIKTVTVQVGASEYDVPA